MDPNVLHDALSLEPLAPGCGVCYAFRPVNTFFTALLQQQAAPSSSPFGSLSGILPLVLMFGVFYLLIIRPQAKKAKLHQSMLSQLKKGDEVATTGGLIGKITGIKDDEVTLQVQEGVRLRILRSAVTGLSRPAAAEPAKAETKASASSS
jgi:preprotein translocase subunit YajC